MKALYTCYCIGYGIGAFSRALTLHLEMYSLLRRRKLCRSLKNDACQAEQNGVRTKEIRVALCPSSGYALLHTPVIR